MQTANSVTTIQAVVNAASEGQNSTVPPTWNSLHPYQTNVLGTVLAITGNVLISISLNIQKYTHVRLLCQESPIPYYKSKLWWCGIVLMGMGELGNFAAYGFAPATLVAPLGCVSVIASAAISVVFLKETLRSSDILASLSVISVKAVSGMVTSSIKGQIQFQYPIFYVMLIIMMASCIFQVQFLNQAMQLYNATEVVPINFVLFTTSAIIAGVIFYQEFHGAAILNIFMFLFGCMLSFLGVFLIARNREKQTSEIPYIDLGAIPKQRSTEKIQPELSNINSYGTVHDGEQTADSPSEDAK
ncbi:NIPA-like protein 2 isoform X4 [Carcharodon carcharias]|uniref:NIPA-like protein 2 isoform X4 n=1 Tax=Carcharodon carcharias TaxID=13397 RepID=UPI001B7E3C04|nr:NIPA-like protein 2 isoform X4 [Carcharodon carcharias]